MALRTSLAAAFLALAAVAGCGPSGGLDIDAGSAICTGCVSGGACEPGNTAQACGTGGDQCMACPSGKTCIDGVCSAPSECAKNCPGCCTAAGMCMPGTDDTACGQHGVMCQSCTPGTCTNASCTGPCGPKTCLGCCDSSGNCVLGDSTTGKQPDDTCGNHGEQCTACSVNEVCQVVKVYDSSSDSYVIAGGCGAAGCDACSPGCCNQASGGGVTCGAGNTTDACGADGAMCQTCQSGDSCTGGQCVPGSSVTFNLELLSAVVPATDSSGSSWDPFGGLPDVSVTPRLEVSPELVGTTVDGPANTTTPTFPDNRALTATVGQFKQGLLFDFVDRDTWPNPDDKMATIPGMPYVPPDAVFTSGAGPVVITSGSYTLTVQFVRQP